MLKLPIVDMPLEKLSVYTGTNPCPADIHDYWNIALAEMNEIDPEVQLKPAPYTFPETECVD